MANETQTMTQTMTVSIWRENGDDGRFEKYEVPARGKTRQCLMLWPMSNSILTPLYLTGLLAALACADLVR